MERRARTDTGSKRTDKSNGTKHKTNTQRRIELALVLERNAGKALESALPEDRKMYRAGTLLMAACVTTSSDSERLRLMMRAKECFDGLPIEKRDEHVIYLQKVIREQSMLIREQIHLRN